MKHILKFICGISIIILFGCTGKGGVLPSSKPYQPEEWEKSMYQRIDRTVFPSDIKKDHKKFQGKFVHWLGIIKQVDIKKKSNSDTCIINVTADQKYWDYIEDYSIQDEHIFLSPKGEGLFIYNFEFPMTADNEKNLKAEVANKSLGMFYGYVYLDSLNNNMPTLIGAGFKIYDYREYTTAIFSYDVERDNNGNVVSLNGVPELANFQKLRVANKGQNK
jgi:hypothetical protein